MTGEFYKTLDGQVLNTRTKGKFILKAEPHQGGIAITFVPESESQRADTLLLYVHDVHDEDEERTSELEKLLINWIETEPRQKSSIGTFNPSKDDLETFAIYVQKN